MSLLEDLREVADKLSPSEQPSAAEVAKIVGALVGYVENPDTFITTIKTDAANLVDNAPTGPNSTPTLATPAGVQDDTRLTALETNMAGIGQQLQNLVASLQATQVAVTQETSQ